jgi:hypothetical protein
MKKSFLTVLIFVCLVGLASAEPFLLCDPQAGVTHYKITGPAWVANLSPVYSNGTATGITAQADGSIRTNVSEALVGTNNITVAACNDDPLWGEACSDYVPFAFERPPAAATPTAIRLVR